MESLRTLLFSMAKSMWLKIGLIRNGHVSKNHRFVRGVLFPSKRGRCKGGGGLEFLEFWNAITLMYMHQFWRRKKNLDSTRKELSTDMPHDLLLSYQFQNQSSFEFWIQNTQKWKPWTPWFPPSSLLLSLLHPLLKSLPKISPFLSFLNG